MTNPAQLNQLVGQFVGQWIVMADGRLLLGAKKVEATGLTVASVPGVMAGGVRTPCTGPLDNYSAEPVLGPRDGYRLSTLGIPFTLTAQ